MTDGLGREKVGSRVLLRRKACAGGESAGSGWRQALLLTVITSPLTLGPGRAVG